MKKTLRSISVLVLVCVLIGAPGALVHAQSTGQTTSGGTTLYNPLQGTTLIGFLNGILDIIVNVGAVLVVLMLVYVGFLFATTSVNPENKVKARTALVWTLVGALILLGAKAISLGIQATVTALGA